MAKITEPRQLLVSELAEMLYVERQQAEAVLPDLGKQVESTELKQGLEKHVGQTREHVVNLEQAFRELGEDAREEKSRTLDGLKAQRERLVKNIESEQLRDIFNAGAAARTEHLEIAAYTSLITLAESVGESEVVDLLEQNLDQEKKTLRELEQASQRLTRKVATV